MNKKELLEELARKGKDDSIITYLPEPVDNKDLVKRLKAIHAAIEALKNTSIFSIVNEVDCICDNLLFEIEELDNPPGPESITLDTVVEKYKYRDHIPDIQLEK